MFINLFCVYSCHYKTKFSGEDLWGSMCVLCIFTKTLNLSFEKALVRGQSINSHLILQQAD